MYPSVKDAIDVALNFISKKWAISILLDLREGRKRFSEIIAQNEGLSNKVLSERLKELIDHGYVRKYIINAIPLVVKYQVTDKSKFLNRLILELSMLGFQDTLLNELNDITRGKLLAELGNIFDLKAESLNEIQERFMS